MEAITLNKLNYNQLELLKGNQISDDVDIDTRQLTFNNNTQRAFLIREMLKNGGKIDNQIEQDLGCLKIIEVPASECCDIQDDCYLLRTEVRLPQFIETDGNNGITKVGPINKLSIPFSYVSYNQAIYSGEGKYNGNMIFAFLLNGYIYLKTKVDASMLIEHINVRGVLEDPTEAVNFNRCGEDGPCFSYDSRYPIHGWMIPIITERVLKQFGISTTLPKDTSNDSKDNVDTNNRK